MSAPNFYLILDEEAAAAIDGVPSPVDPAVTGTIRREITNIPCTQTHLWQYFPEVLKAYIDRKGGGCSILYEGTFLVFP